jgi:putative spermidine/putrescine transport system ATP-binding protein
MTRRHDQRRSDGPDRGALSLYRVSKRYGDVVAVDEVSLDVEPGEFVTLLGPSGSGKTTTLRIIAGFVKNDGGEVVLDGRQLTGVPPYKRDVGMVFQNYALFPHMTSAENIAFPLKMRRHGRREIRERVEQALELVHLTGLGGRYPRQLSGGQQQRVAVARAIVFSPRVLLMDEPLGALDKKLREALQLEVMRLSRQLGVSVIYVTHDQEEALVMSDRIAIYDEGRIQQVGTAEELYERPASLFVADFVGESNIFSGRLDRGADGPLLAHGSGSIRLDEGAFTRAGLAYGSPAAVVVRPERMSLGLEGEGGGQAEAASLRGRIQETIYLGAARKFIVRLADGTIVSIRPQRLDEAARLSVGDEVAVGWERRYGVVVPDARHPRTAGGEAERELSTAPPST